MHGVRIWPAEHQETQQRGEECAVCGRRFRRESDKVHHKCAAERRPVCEQVGVRSVGCGFSAEVGWWCTGWKIVQE